MTRKAIRRIVCLIMMLTLSVSAGAVLKEKDLKSTLSVLCAELETAYNEQRQNIARYTNYNQAQHKQMISLMQRSDQVALMLYSQKQDFTFDMTYACHEATEMYREFTQRSVPYNTIMARMSSEIKRYDYLIETLQNIPPSLRRKPAKDGKEGPKQQKYITGKDGKQMPLPFMLDKAGQANRNACLTYAYALRGNLVKMRASVEKDSQHYKRMSEKLKKVNDYALQRYNDIQHNIFVNGDQNYLEIITSMPTAYHNAKADVQPTASVRSTRSGAVQS